jgi:hypothetical protein
MLVNILTGILGVVIFLFVFWKRLKEDYSSEIIFQVATAILVGIGVGSTLSSLFFKDWLFWVNLLGIFLAILLMRIKYKLRFYESLEAVIMAFMPWLAILFLKDSVTTSSLSSFLGFIAILVMIFFSYWLDVSYKSFRWYKSGRVGFAGLTISIVFFLTRTVLAIFNVTMLSFVGNFEAIFSGIMVLTSLLLLIKLKND